MAQLFGDSFKNRRRLVERLDGMVRSGKVTAGEAEAIRAAPTNVEFEAAVVAIRSRHAEARLTAAVEAGQMTQAECDADLDRIRSGGHPRGLHAHLAKISPRK